MSTIEFRRARATDYPYILQLQSENYIANLSPEERWEGFLSAQFSAEQTAQVAEDLGTTVAVLNDQVAGFLCAFRQEFETGSPVIAKMLESYTRLRFEGRTCTSRAYCGPVYRPRVPAARLRCAGFTGAKTELAGQFEVACLVARTNPHSLQAHVQGLGMIEAGDFEVNRSQYAVLAFRLPSKVHR
jgi:hypothetical protein